MNDIYRDGDSIERPSVRGVTANIDPVVVRSTYPNAGERVIRVILHITGIIVLALVSAILIFSIISAARIVNALNDLGTPDPGATGCPFGEGNCGG